MHPFSEVDSNLTKLDNKTKGGTVTVALGQVLIPVYIFDGDIHPL
jgi:hypothetical protein